MRDEFLAFVKQVSLMDELLELDPDIDESVELVSGSEESPDDGLTELEILASAHALNIKPNRMK
jgi:hypothetical protein